MWGVLATGVMSLVTYAGLRTGLLPLPEAVPIALAEAIAGELVSGSLLIALSGTAHLLYGGFWGAVLSVARRQVRFIHGLLLGVALWVIMGLMILPIAGWGMFALDLGYKVGAATLLTHLVYGMTLGLLFERGQEQTTRTPPTVKLGSPGDP